ncbi:MAG: phage late control D family protein [Candidatus Izimaplasma sp.]|nr:phage late control D family protein [Candidatus Izimaplasma bacterium]
MANFKIDNTKYEIMKAMDKYSDFNAPAYKILIQGTDIVTKEYMAITKVEVETNTKEADFASFVVSNAYDRSKAVFEWSDKYFLPGEKVEIKMGYVDKLETVFIGVISSVTFSIGDESTPNVIIGCMDKSFLMMKAKKYKLWYGDTYSDIVKAIGSDYKFNVIADSTEITYETVVQNFQTDYEFIMELSKRSSRDFFISGEQLYFKDVYKEKAPIITLTIGKELIEFEYELDIAEQLTSVEVKGYNIEKEKLSFVAKDINKMGIGNDTGISFSKKLDSKNTSYVLSDVIITNKEAEIYAKSILNNQSRKFVSAYAKLLGFPEIRAGRYISIKGMWKTEERLFYIKSCKHEFDYNGFITMIDMEANTI